ncbi:hypothetical protein CsatB_025182 [Cannabis sativa]
MMRKVIVVLVTLVIINLLCVDSVEGGRVLNERRDLNNLLILSLQRGGNKPPSPNPTKPASFDERNFAGSTRSKLLAHSLPPPPPTAPIQPKSSAFQ